VSTAAIRSIIRFLVKRPAWLEDGWCLETGVESANSLGDAVRIVGWVVDARDPRRGWREAVVSLTDAQVCRAQGTSDGALVDLVREAVEQLLAKLEPSHWQRTRVNLAMEAIQSHLEERDDALDVLVDWLLEQRVITPLELSARQPVRLVDPYFEPQRVADARFSLRKQALMWARTRVAAEWEAAK
jgi:hypothetical protein